MVKSEGICNLRRYVGITADSGYSRLVVLAFFRIKFRENDFVVFYILFLFFF